MFTGLIKTLKDRKNLVIGQVDEYFKNERATISAEELKWRER